MVSQRKKILAFGFILARIYCVHSNRFTFVWLRIWWKHWFIRLSQSFSYQSHAHHLAIFDDFVHSAVQHHVCCWFQKCWKRQWLVCLCLRIIIIIIIKNNKTIVIDGYFYFFKKIKSTAKSVIITNFRMICFRWFSFP